MRAAVVKEALRLLGEPGFGEANEEFMTARRHLREGNLRDSNAAALRAMKTVLKVICAPGDGRARKALPSNGSWRWSNARSSLPTTRRVLHEPHRRDESRRAEDPRSAGRARCGAGRRPRAGPRRGVRAPPHAANIVSRSRRMGLKNAQREASVRQCVE